MEEGGEAAVGGMPIPETAMIMAIARTMRPAPSPGSPEKKWGNGARRRRVEFPARAGGGMSNKQKAKLAMMAKQAFLAVNGRAAGSQAEDDGYRHGEIQKAVGKAGLRVCVQGDYKILERWFLELLGRHGAAFEAQMESETEPRRVAMAKLAMELKARKLPPGWVAKICRAKFKCGLSEASAGQIWKLVFDVRKSKHKVVKETDEPF